jgi:hypothetical protein
MPVPTPAQESGPDALARSDRRPPPALEDRDEYQIINGSPAPVDLFNRLFVDKCSQTSFPLYQRIGMRGDKLCDKIVTSSPALAPGWKVPVLVNFIQFSPYRVLLRRILTVLNDILLLRIWDFAYEARIRHDKLHECMTASLGFPGGQRKIRGAVMLRG